MHRTSNHSVTGSHPSASTGHLRYVLLSNSPNKLYLLSVLLNCICITLCRMFNKKNVYIINKVHMALTIIVKTVHRSITHHSIMKYEPKRKNTGLGG